MFPLGCDGITKSSFHKAVASSFISFSPVPSAWCMVLPTKCVCDEEGQSLVTGRECAESNPKVRVVDILLSITVVPTHGTLHYYSTDMITPVDKN